MLNYSYYPFKSKLDNVSGNDLRLLSDVSEGWYIEYKSQDIKIADYAKYLSAFANQYGGWLIIGIREGNNANRTASEYIGICNSVVDDILTKIREASAAHTSPEVLYEIKVVQGPCAEIDLPDDKSIIIVGIPSSDNTPHIHSSGRIYRRLSDQSKPKEENDRYILDDLWKRGINKKKRTAKRLTDIPCLPKSQSEMPIAHVFFMPAQGQPIPSRKLSFMQFSDIVKNKDDCISGLCAPMESVYTTTQGYVARQIKNNNPGAPTFTLRWWHDGVVRFDIPLNAYDLQQIRASLSNYKHIDEYYEQAILAGYSNMKVVDYSMLVQSVSSLANSFIHILNTTDDSRDHYSCFTLRNIFYTSPYVESGKFIERINTNSIPLMLEKEIVVPQEPSQDTMTLHQCSRRSHRDISEKHALPYLFSMPLIYRIFESIGIWSEVNDIMDDMDAWGFDFVNNNQDTP